MTSSSPPLHELISEGQPLVRSLALRIFHDLPLRVDLDDLIAYGQVGLAEAAREFNPSHGCQFTTFAYYRIRGAIYDGVSQMSWTSRAQLARMRYQQRANEVIAEQTREGTTDESPARWFGNITERLAVVYLSMNRDEDGNSGIGELADRTESPSATAASREINQKLAKLIDTLPTLEKNLIRDLYFEGSTLQQAASRLGISKSWASRLHAKVLEDLGRTLRRMGANEEG